MAQTTKPTPSLIEQLYARDAQAAESQRGGAGRAYLAALNKHAGPPGILAVLEAERRALAACDSKVRPALLAVLDKYPEPPPEARRIIADAVRAIRRGAQGGLDTLDRNPAALEDWVRRITSIADDVGSPTHLAVAHWDHIRTLLDRARGLLAVPTDLKAAAQALETLSARLLASGVPVGEVSRGSGPLPESLEKPKARGAYRAETTVRHED